MKKAILILSGLVYGSLFMAGPASAVGYMRCGVHTISESQRSGMGKYEVSKKCGKPTAKFGNTWIYEKGGTKRILRFNDAGRLIAIEGSG